MFFHLDFFPKVVMKRYLLLMKAGKKSMDTKEVVKYREGLGIEDMADVNIKRPTHFFLMPFFLFVFSEVPIINLHYYSIRTQVIF